MTDTEPGAERLITFNQAERVNAYELARKWGAHEWPARLPAKFAAARGVAVRGVVDDLEELAVMAALRKWLDAWTPGQIHSALLAGASVEQVAAASGLDPFEVSAAWHEWSAGQRHLWQTFPDMDHTAEHDRVAAILAEVPHEFQSNPPGFAGSCGHCGRISQAPIHTQAAGYSTPTQEPER